MRRIASLAGAIVATALLAAQPAAADGLNGAGKSPLFESGFSGWTCATGAVTTAVATEGFVVLNTEASGDLSAEVALKDARPDATYFIFVNQFPGDCPTAASGTITTNAEGNGTGHFVEPRVPSAIDFWVSALTFGPPIAQGVHSRAVVLN